MNDARGKRHHRWKGDNVGYEGIHSWIRRLHPKAGRCEYCGCRGRTDYASAGHTYTRDWANWFELCRRCHDTFDGKTTVSAETRAKISAANKGRVLSAETRARMSAARKGKRHSPEHRANLAASLAAANRRRARLPKELS